MPSASLPIIEVMPALLQAIGSSEQVILKAAPGAGKSTHLPLCLLQQQVGDVAHLSGKIIMMEPRRLAARNIAHYLAKQLGESVGETVGYRIKGDSKVSAKTRLEIVTEGVMTKMIQSDPELSGIDLIIFDEFHERSIHADTALAFGLEVQQALRDDLKILVMSATLDQQALCTLLPDAQYIESQGRGYPIEYHYSPLKPNEYLVPRLAQLIPRWMAQQSGSMLVFLPGVGDIVRLQQALVQQKQHHANLNNIDICPLYGQLDHQAQQMAIQPSMTGRRKICLATNIAETSLTIEGIRMVIDSGLERSAKFDPKTGITKLDQHMIAQSSAEQRAGRAGRLEAGICIRLYSQEMLQQQVKVPLPEILRSDLTSLQMELIQWGALQADELMWLDNPPQSNLSQAKDLLQTLGLLDVNGQLTSMAKLSQGLGVEPRLAAMILKAQALGAKTVSAAIALVALLEEPEKSVLDISHSLHRWQQKSHPKTARLNQRSQQLANKIKQLNISAFNSQFSVSSVDAGLFGVCAAIAFPDRIAMQRAGSLGEYILANGHGASMPEHDGLAAEAMIVAIDVMRTVANKFSPASAVNSQIFTAVSIDVREIQNELPHLIQAKTQVQWDDSKGKIIAEQQQRIGQLVLERRRLPKPEPELITSALLDYIRRKGLSALPWNDSSNNLLHRMRNGRDWLPNEAWPLLDDSDLLAQLEHWLAPYMLNIETVAQLKKVNLTQALLAYLAWPLNKSIDEWLPTHYTLPTGNRKAIRYQDKSQPVLSVRMQEMFGESDSPLIAQGQKKLVLELLSPAQRPLQITQDLAGFWQGSYKEVQREMKGRYPKHVWPDNPATHEATAKTKRNFNK
ncbi:ATP-dependent helicase HrpB [Vibrio algicola]|nr:ATP-dependent helicase HrpB [Vibrio algicola]